MATPKSLYGNLSHPLWLEGSFCSTYLQKVCSHCSLLSMKILPPHPEPQALGPLLGLTFPFLKRKSETGSKSYQSVSYLCFVPRFAIWFSIIYPRPNKSNLVPLAWIHLLKEEIQGALVLLVVLHYQFSVRSIYQIQDQQRIADNN